MPTGFSQRLTDVFGLRFCYEQLSLFESCIVLSEVGAFCAHSQALSVHVIGATCKNNFKAYPVPLTRCIRLQ